MTFHRHIMALSLALLVLNSGCAGIGSNTAGDRTAPSSAEWLRSQDDFKRLGLGPEVELWEDGYRSAELADSFEWWYFDALLDDGTVVVAWVGHHWPPDNPGWVFSLDITPPDGPTVLKYIQFDQPDFVGREKAEVRIGRHRFEGNLESYRIVVDPESMDGFGLDLTLTRRVPSYRPATGHFGSADRYFAWLVAVPEGAVTGSLTMSNKTRQVVGSGYHDHNWGNISPNDLMANWWWGRAAVGPYTVVIAELRARPELGGSEHPLMLVTSPQGQVVNVLGQAELDLVEDAARPHPDPKHGQPIAAGVTVKAHNQAVQAHFGLTDKVLTSVDILETVSFFKRIAGRLVGASPWYTRVDSPVELTIDGRTVPGQGTLEFMDFE